MAPEKAVKKEKRTSLATLDFDDAVRAAIAVIKAGRTPFLEGQPGCGKTATAKVIWKKLDLDGMITITPTMHNALDLRGFGYVEDIKNSEGMIVGKQTRFAQSCILPSSGRWLVFVDELPDCPKHEQSGFYQLVLEKRIGEHILPPGCVVMAAGNGVTHRAAANVMSTALRTRLTTLKMAPTTESVCKYALESKWHPLVISFMRSYDKAVNGFDPDDFAGGCTPRDLEIISNLENQGWPDGNNESPLSLSLCEGNLGTLYGQKYNGHRRISIPDPGLAIKDPANAKIDYPKDVMYAYLAAVAQRATPQNFPKIAEYGKRLGDVFDSVLMTDCLVANKEIAHTEIFDKWYKSNEHRLIAY